MILVDSSVWIDFFNGKETPAADRLTGLLQSERVAIGDLILTEVLQGFRSDRAFNTGLQLLSRPALIEIGGRAVAERAAVNYRLLRAKGSTIRSTIDTLIATRCILDGHELLFSDRDFQPFVEHLGLRPALATS